MSDQRVWVKVWLNWLMDRDIQSLSFADKGRWIELLLLVAEHGRNGEWICAKGAANLPGTWRKGASYVEVVKRLTSLPGVAITGGNHPLQQLTITFTNWHKYQVGSSTERVKRWRTSTVTKPVTKAVTETPEAPPSVTGEEERRREKNSEQRYSNGRPTTPPDTHLNLPDDPAERRRIYDAERRSAFPD